MASNSYPHDELGNTLKVDDLVHFVFKDPGVLCSVIQVDPATIIEAPDGGTIPMEGRIVLQTIIPLRFFSDNPRMAGLLAVSVPDPGLLTLVKQ